MCILGADSFIHPGGIPVCISANCSIHLGEFSHSSRRVPRAALAGGDARTALDIHVAITTTDWADNGAWLMGLKRLIEIVSKLGVAL